MPRGYSRKQAPREHRGVPHGSNFAEDIAFNDDKTADERPHARPKGVKP